MNHPAQDLAGLARQILGHSLVVFLSHHDEAHQAAPENAREMLELAESNRLLAESNREMVDYLADQQGEDAGDEAPRRDLAGRPI